MAKIHYKQAEYGYMNAPISCMRGAEFDFAKALGRHRDYAIGKYLTECIEGLNMPIEEAKEATETYFSLADLGEVDVCLATFAQHTDKPNTGIKVQVLYYAIDEAKREKQGEGLTEEGVMLLAVIALNSIYNDFKQAGRYAKTSKSVLIARMQGYTNPDDVPTEANTPFFESLRDKWKAQRKWNKFIDNLCERWHLGYFSKGARGFYFSFKIFHDEIQKRVEQAKAELTKRRGSRGKLTEELPKFT